MVYKCNYCPGKEAALVIIVVSLADSICRHPDVTLESGLVPHTIGGSLIVLRKKAIKFKA